MSKFYEYIIKIGDRSSGPLKDIASNGERAAEKLDGASRSAEGLGRTLDKIKTIAATALITLASFETVKGISKLGMDMEQTRISFETMLGSADKAAKMLGEIKEFAAKTPFETEDITKAAQLMLNFGFAQKDIMKNIQLLGDVSGGNKERFQGLSIVFSQVGAMGKLMGQDLLQMINQGFNPLQIISQKTGQSMAKLKDDMAKGLITFDMVKGAFETATSAGGRFYNLMQRQSETMAGRLSTLSDNMKETGVKMGEGINVGLGAWVDLASKLVNNKRITEALIGLFEKVGQKLKSMAEWVEKNAAFFQKLADTAFFLVGTVWRVFTDIVTTLVDRFRDLYAWVERNHEVFMRIGRTVLIATGFILTYKAALLAVTLATQVWGAVTAIANTVVAMFTKGFGILNMVMELNPIALVITAIVALAGVFVYAYNHLDKFRATLWGLWSAASTVFTNILNAAKDTFVPLGELIQAVKEGRWLDAAKAGGKLLLNVSMLPGKLALDAVTGKLTKGVADSYKEGYDKGLKDKGLQLPAGIQNLVNKFTGKGAPAGSEGAITPAAENLAPDTNIQQGIDNISGGGKGIRNVTVNIDALWKGNITNTNPDFRQTSEDLKQQLIELLVKAVGGAEGVLSNG